MNKLSKLNTSVLFTNWTDEDFVCNWNGEPYVFPAKFSEEISVGTQEHNLGLAKHFAKHLVDRELNKRGVPTDHFSRTQLEDQCFLDVEEVTSIPTYNVEMHKESGLVAKVEITGREEIKKGKGKGKAAKKVVEDEEKEVTTDKNSEFTE